MIRFVLMLVLFGLFIGCERSYIGTFPLLSKMAQKLFDKEKDREGFQELLLSNY